MAASTIVIVILALALILWVTEIIPIGVTAVSVCIALALTKATSLSVAFGGFSTDVVILIAGTMVIGHALFKTGVAQAVGSAIVRKVGNRQLPAMMAILITATILTAFLSNAAVTAMFIPLIAAIAAGSKGKFSGKYVYLPLSWAVNSGGMITLVGATPQLVAQSILVAGGYAGFSIFSFAPLGVILSIVTLVYSCTIGYKLSQKVFANSINSFVAAEQTAKGTEGTEKKRDMKLDGKAWIAGGTMLLVIFLFVTQPYHKYPVGLIAMLGAAILVITGCISEKEAYKAIDWPTVMIVACTMGLATAMSKTGAGKIIADVVLGWTGNSLTPTVFLVVVVVLSTVLTQIMSCTGTVAVLCPIVLFIAKGMGIDPHGIVVAVIIGSSIAMATPIGSAPTAMVIGPGQYHFMDYVKLGSLLTAILLVLTIAFVPVFFPM